MDAWTGRWSLTPSLPFQGPQTLRVDHGVLSPDVLASWAPEQPPLSLCLFCRQNSEQLCAPPPRPLAPGLLTEGVALCPPQQDVRFGVDTHTPCTVSLGFTWV